jgi:hypothetical protein
MIHKFKNLSKLCLSTVQPKNKQTKNTNILVLSSLILTKNFNYTTTAFQSRSHNALKIPFCYS